MANQAYAPFKIYIKIYHYSLIIFFNYIFKYINTYIYASHTLSTYIFISWNKHLLLINQLQQQAILLVLNCFTLSVINWLFKQIIYPKPIFLTFTKFRYIYSSKPNFAKQKQPALPGGQLWKMLRILDSITASARTIIVISTVEMTHHYFGEKRQHDIHCRQHKIMIK